MVAHPRKRAKHSHEPNSEAHAHAQAQPPPRQPPLAPQARLNPPLQASTAASSPADSDSSASWPLQTFGTEHSLDSEDSRDFDSSSFPVFDIFQACDADFWQTPALVPIPSQTSQPTGSLLHPAFPQPPHPLTEPPFATGHAPLGQFTHRPTSQTSTTTNDESLPAWPVSHSAAPPPALLGLVAFEASLPTKDMLQASRDLSNPFQDNAVERIPAVTEPRPLENGVVNGYIKCRFHGMQLRFQTRLPYASSLENSCQALSTRLGPEHHASGSLSVASTSFPPTPLVDPRTVAEGNIQRLPKDFGRDVKLSAADWQLFVFYRGAWCAGRAILDSSNCWLVNIVQMAPRSPAVLHAMLALAGIYVLDYLADDRIRLRSNTHYSKAVKLLTKELRDKAQQKPGGGESIVASIALLNMLDVVSPERRRSKKEIPRWLEGAQVACKVLDATDPGHRYWDANNVQPSDARVANTIITSRAVILALPMTPLNDDSSDSRHFQWLLLQTSEENSRKVHGACGCSPRLLHRFALITHLAALIERDPDSIVYPIGAEALAQELNELRQWSELNCDGYSSVEALLAACNLRLDSAGVVADKVSMTDLTAEAWRLAAIIYLHCRLFRLPRSHPMVITPMTYLAACISRMPTAGPLFTAQAPFFPVFLLGLLAVQPEHHHCAMHWFESVIRTSCRSSVPPAYEALLRVRTWMDSTMKDDDFEIPSEIDRRFAWWEVMVARVTEEEGILCLI